MISLNENIKIVLNNINLVIANKEKIQNSIYNSVSIDGLKSIAGNQDVFVKNIGACTNLNLWLLDDSKCPTIFNYEGQFEFHREIDLMTYLGAKFSDLYGDETTDSNNPIIHKVRTQLWDNQLRWDYLDFLIEELEYYLAKEKVKSNQTQI